MNTKKLITVLGICCVLPLLVVGLLLSSRGKQSATSGQPSQIKTAVGTADIGNTFPAFSVTDVDGTSITNATLKGKPTIIWFTATFCTPCQIGAKMVSALQKELGDDKLNVLVFFVDPSESATDLRGWRDKYANPSWKLAFNNGLAEKIGIKFLDSKYLLDKEGVIKNFNTQIVNQQYLDLIKSAIK